MPTPLPPLDDLFLGAAIPTVPRPAANALINARAEPPAKRAKVAKVAKANKPKAKSKPRGRPPKPKREKVEVRPPKPKRAPKPITPDDLIERVERRMDKRSPASVARADRRPHYPRITTSTLHMSFRFSEDDKDLLCKLALANGLSMSAAMKMALRDSARVQGVVVRKGSGFGVVVDRETLDEVVVDSPVGLEYGALGPDRAEPIADKPDGDAPADVTTDGDGHVVCVVGPEEASLAVGDLGSPEVLETAPQPQQLTGVMINARIQAAIAESKRIMDSAIESEEPIDG